MSDLRPGTSTAASPDRTVRLTDLGVSAVGGALTLIPVRHWPRWLRVAYVGVPALVAGAAAGVLGALPTLKSDTIELLEADEDTPPDAADPASGEAEHSAPDSAEVSPDEPHEAPLDLVRGGAWAVAAAAGSVALGWGALALDGALEKGLRRVGSTRPRLVMGAATAAILYAGSFTSDVRRHS